jgi:hypothetical protein
MNNYQQHLVQELTNHISLNLSRAKCLAELVSAMISCRTVNLAILCHATPSNIKAGSWYRRMQRFMAEISICWRALPKLIARVMKLEELDGWVLCMDRTNWKFGKQHINILYLAVSFKGVAIPLFGKFYPIKSKVILTTMTV